MTRLNAVHNTMRSSIWGFLSRILSMLAAFAVRTIILKELGAEYIGLNSLFLSVLGVLNLSELGFSSAIVFAMYKPISIGDEKTVGQLLFFLRRVYLNISLFITVIGLAILPLFPYFISDEVPADINIYVLYAMFLSSVVFSYLFASYRMSLFLAYQRNDSIAKINIVADIFCYGVQIAVLLLTRNYYMYIAVLILTHLPRNLLIAKFSRTAFPTIHPTDNLPADIVQKIKLSIVPLTGHKVGATVLVSIDSIIISAFLGLQVLGLYNNYYFLVISVISFTSIIQQAIVAAIGNKLSYLDVEGKRQLFKNLSFAWYALIGICTCCLISLTQPFIDLWLGSSFTMPNNTMVLLAAYYYCWQFRVIGLTFKDAAGLWKNDWKKPYIGMALNFLFSILLVLLLKNVIAVLIPTTFIMIFIYFPWETSIISKEILECNKNVIIVRALAQTALIASCAVGCFYLNNILIVGDGVVWLLVRFVIAVSLPSALHWIIYRNTKMYAFLKRTIIKRGIERTAALENVRDKL